MNRPEPVYRTDRLAGMAERLAAIDGAVGVCLGGSRARGTHRPDSDFDLGLYYRAPLDTAALRVLATELTGRHIDLTEPGGWGPWVDGGAWLVLAGGVRVDWIYRSLDRVRHYADECRAGRFELGIQAGHPLGFYSHAYLGELALGHVLADPSGDLTELQAAVAQYPEPLRTALVDTARWEVPFTLANARKGVVRGDAYYVHGCLFRAVGLLTQALHALAGEWLINEKGAVESAGRLPCAPREFASRAHQLFTLEAGPALDAAEALAAEVLSG